MTCTRYMFGVITLDGMHSSAILSLLVFFFVKSQLELVRGWRESSRHRHRRHPSRWSLAQTERLLFPPHSRTYTTYMYNRAAISLICVVYVAHDIAGWEAYNLHETTLYC